LGGIPSALPPIFTREQDGLRKIGAFQIRGKIAAKRKKIHSLLPTGEENKGVPKFPQGAKRFPSTTFVGKKGQQGREVLRSSGGAYASRSTRGRGREGMREIRPSQAGRKHQLLGRGAESTPVEGQRPVSNLQGACRNRQESWDAALKRERC